MPAPRPATHGSALPRHSLRVWLAALALFVQALLPVQVLRAAALPGEAISFCSAAGAPATHLTGADGGPLSDSGHKTGMVCPLCTAAGAAAVPPVDPAGALPSPVRFAAVDFARHDEIVPAAGGSAAYGSRAPPTIL
ncbi:MAG: DUF2946 family protein [Rhodospirillales bacterium]|nr:DUF2946 family protein [Rhodospirillales bacterium]